MKKFSELKFRTHETLTFLAAEKNYNRQVIFKVEKIRFLCLNLSVT
jgi:hypothetical protein